MKINIDRIPVEGAVIEDTVLAQDLELDTEDVRFKGPIKVTASLSRITNAVTIGLDLEARIIFVCSRCIEHFDWDFKKHIPLNYSVDKSEHEIDLDPEIREDIIIEYPLKPLCRPDCKGLCLVCGSNLNLKECSCKKGEQ
jgi:uncharacterized protein